MKLPVPDPDVLAKRESLIEALGNILNPESILTSEAELRAYECDGLTAYRQQPLVVVLPETTEEVSRILKLCESEGVKVVARGAGTSLSGGALPLQDAVLLSMMKFSQLKVISFEDRCVVAGPGVTNKAITDAVSHRGYYYAPDPSSRIACSIGGNVAENAGGMHCLKYGLTTNNVIGLEAVMMNGEVIRVGGRHLDHDPYDILGLMAGSEGLLAIVTEVTVRILKSPEFKSVLLLGFEDTRSAGACVAGVIKAGIVPAAMEMMDKLAIEASEGFVPSGYPLNAGAVLIIEVDGTKGDVEELCTEIANVARDHRALSVQIGRTPAEQEAMWAGRMSAFPSVGRISPDYYCMDGTIPRRKLSEVLTRIEEMSATFDLRVANVFHAGDGNLHPLILYDANEDGELERAEKFGEEILKLCVEVGGVLTGEHGVGVEKRDLMEVMFDEIDLNVQQRLKCAFDPQLLLNPGKVFPKLHRCAELGRVHVHSEDGHRFKDIPRF